MKTHFQVQNPDDIEVTISMTMKIGHWRALRAQLATSYPSWQVSEAISQATSQMLSVVHVEPPQSKPAET